MAFRRSRSIYLACTAVSALLLSNQAFAQQQTDPGAVQLDRLVIEQAKKRKAAAAASDTPLATQTTEEEIAKREIGDIKDLGNTTEPGVDYSKRTDGASIRGLSGPRVATVIDGIPIPYLENFARGGGPTGSTTNSDGGGSSFDFSSLSALDVLRGGDSSRIGSGVLGGALVLRTLEPQDLIEEGRNWGGLGKLTYDSADRGITGSTALAARFGDTSALLQGSYKKANETETNGDVGGYGRPRTEADPADFDQNNILFKLRHDLEGGHQIGITAERFDRQIDTNLASMWTRIQGGGPTPLYSYPVNGYFGHDDSLRERVSLDYNFVSPEAGGLVESAFAKAYWQRLTKNAGAEGTQVRVAGGTQIPYYRDNELQESDLGFIGGATGNFTTGSLEHKWSAGVDIQSLSTTGYVTAIPLASARADIADVDGTRFGAFIDDRIALGDGRFALTPGVRFDWFQYTPQEGGEYANNPGAGLFDFPERSDWHFSPKLLATYEVNPNVELFAQWSAPFRGPTINELYLNFANPTQGYAQIGNPDLKSETGHAFEIGANFGTDDFGGRITAFHNRYRNFIDSTDPDFGNPDPNTGLAIGSFFNREKVEISGVELNAHKLFENGIRFHGGLSYVYGKDVTTGEFLRSVAPFKGIAGIGYERENWGVDLTGIFVGKVKKDGPQPDGRGGTYDSFDAPGYAIANLTGWWEPEAVKGMRIQAGIYNLFDETYYDALANRSLNLAAAASSDREFYSEPGRTFKLSLTQRF